jgi:hypothetical protein
MRNRELVVQTEFFLAIRSVLCLTTPSGMETEGSGLEMRVVACDLRLSLALGDV